MLSGADAVVVDPGVIEECMRVLRTTPKRGPLVLRSALVGRRAEAAAVAAAQAGLADQPGFPTHTYGELLTAVYDRLHAARGGADAGALARLPVPQTAKASVRTKWTNFATICKRLHRDPDHVKLFFQIELGVAAVIIDGQGHFIIRGRLDVKTIEDGIRKYVGAYVECGGCRAWTTTMSRDPTTRLWGTLCSSCGCHRTVPTLKAGFRAATRADRIQQKKQAAE
jgi:translation initiation factor 2 beta subunit (eIF-2beta)/eIF-5